MDAQHKVELTMVLSQISTLIDRLEELGEEERTALSALPKRGKERAAAQNLCDGIDDAIDSLTDAIHCLEDGMGEET